MAFTNVTAAVLMKGRGRGVRRSWRWSLVLVLGVAAGALNGLLVVITRVPDIIVTLAMSFVWAGAALLVLNTPGGGAADWVKSLSVGSYVTEWVPRALVLMARRHRRRLDPAAAVAPGPRPSTPSAATRLAALRSGVDVAADQDRGVRDRRASSRRWAAWR